MTASQFVPCLTIYMTLNTRCTQNQSVRLQLTYLCKDSTLILRWLFSWCNFSNRNGSCLDASIRASVGNSPLGCCFDTSFRVPVDNSPLLFTLKADCEGKAYPRGWTVFDAEVLLRNVAIIQQTFFKFSLKTKVSYPDVWILGSMTGNCVF